MAGPGLPPDVIEKLRTIGLKIDRAGRLWHQGEEVAHPRLRQAILRWLDVRDDGRDIVRLDDLRYAYVDVEDAHLRATSARWDGDAVTLHLDDDTEEELDYDSLRLGEAGAMYCRVRGKRLRARLTTMAQQVLAPHIVEDAAAPSGFSLAARGRTWPIS
jgi:hypothetical protein